MANIPGNIGMPKLIPIVDVRTTVIFDVLTGAFDAIMEALTLKLTVLLRWGIPSTGLPISRRRRGTLWRAILLGYHRTGRTKKSQRKCWCCKPCKFHIDPFKYVQ